MLHGRKVQKHVVIFTKASAALTVHGVTSTLQGHHVIHTARKDHVVDLLGLVEEVVPPPPHNPAQAFRPLSLALPQQKVAFFLAVGLTHRLSALSSQLLSFHS